MSSNNPNKDFRCDIDDSEWEFTKPYTSIVTEVGPTSSHAVKSPISPLDKAISSDKYLLSNFSPSTLPPPLPPLPLV